LTYGTLLSSQGTDAHWQQDFSRFSGQTAKSSPWLRARQNGGNGLDREVMLYGHVMSVPQQGM
jgi:hypothetical protein